MAAISDDIERFILELLAETGQAELQRNTLAQNFSCAPSQINYVLATRFNPDRGYVIESRRGGGGYVRVVRLRIEPDATRQLADAIGESISQAKAKDLLVRLIDAGYLRADSAKLLFAATAERVLGQPPDGDRLRASIYRAAITELLKQNR